MNREPVSKMMMILLSPLLQLLVCDANVRRSVCKWGMQECCGRRRVYFDIERRINM